MEATRFIPGFKDVKAHIDSGTVFAREYSKTHLTIRDAATRFGTGTGTIHSAHGPHRTRNVMKRQVACSLKEPSHAINSI